VDGIGGQIARWVKRPIIGDETAAAPTLPLGVILPHLVEFCVPQPFCKALRNDAVFQKIEFRCQQIAYVNDIAESQSNIPISINALARTFDWPRSRVKAALEPVMKPPGHRGKLAAIDEVHEQQIIAWIQESAETSTSVQKQRSKITVHENFRLPSLEAG
jgi:hypothetical protein